MPWDNTNCVFAAAPSSWSNGNGTSNQNIGNFPTYPNGAGQNCVLTNMAVGYGYVYNAGDGYLNFDGINDYVICGSDAALNDLSTKTIELWVYPITGIQAPRLIHKADGGASTNGWDLFFSRDLESILYRQDFVTNRGTWITPNNSVPLNTLTHILIAYDDSNNSNDPLIFVNGSSVVLNELDTPNGNAKSDATNSLTMGNWGTTTTRNYSGRIQWVAIYSDLKDQAYAAANFALGRDMGQVGTNTGDVMALAASVVPISSGEMRFEDADGNSIDVPVPSFPYKTIIQLPFEWQKQDDGTWEGYDHGTDYDKRSCECSYYFDVTDMQSFNNFFRTDGQGRGRDVTMSMNANSGFFPFGADKGDVGDFEVALIIKKHGTVGESPFRYFKVDVIIYNTGSWPAYTPPAEVSEGNLTIGTISNLRFPPKWFKPKVEYGEFVTIEQNSTSQWIDRSNNYDWYETGFGMVCNESKAAALIAYLVDTARVNVFTTIPPTDSYMWGRDQGSTNTYRVNMIQDKITIVVDVNNRHSLGLNFALETLA